MQGQKYILAFAITAAIFATAFYIANRFDANRVANIRATQEAVSINILSLETQFDLLGSLGLRDGEDRAKEAWEAWEAASNRPYDSTTPPRTPTPAAATAGR